MLDKTGQAERISSLSIGFAEFVAMMAAIMAMTALSIDSMLPALPVIGRSLGITNENDQQWIISVFMLGFGATQLIYGPLADRYGRKPIVVGALSCYIVTSLAASFATSFEMMLIARFFQGTTAAAGRVLVVSIVRDCYAGRTMARVMSLTFIIFLIAPALAPSLGQLIMLVAPWRAIFDALALFGLVCLIWFSVRIPETLHPAYRRPIDVKSLAAASRIILTERNSLGYTLAAVAVVAPLMGYVMSAQQVFADVFHATSLFPLIFAMTAASMGISSFINSRVVERYGSRRISHGALLGMVVASGCHLLWTLTVGDTLISFTFFQCFTFFFFGFTGSNFNAMAMDAMGSMAGIASSIQGTISTLGAAALGTIIGQAFNGTDIPLIFSTFCCGLVTVVIVMVTENGRLFRPHHETATDQ